MTDTGAALHADVVWIRLQRPSTGAKAAAAAAAAATAAREGNGNRTVEAGHGHRSLIGLPAVVQAQRASKRRSLRVLSQVFCWGVV